MAKILSTDFCSMMAAMNHMIISEVKKALALLPGKCIEADSDVPLCHIIVSPSDDYSPRDLRVCAAWLDEDDCLNVRGYEGDERTWTTDYDEECAEWYDISDFDYLISQVADRLEGDEEYDVRYTERQNLFYSPRKIGDEVEWINPEGKVCRTTINGILAEQEDQEPVEIIYTTNIMVGNQLRLAYLSESAVLNKQ